MKFADDERARVPFALVGVVLLVASATAAAALATHDPAPTRTRGDRAADRVETAASVALSSAARTALNAAARNPVVAPANTTYGAAIDPNRTFRDSAALRVYARTERALRAVDARAGGVTASVSLPRVQTTADAARAIDAVTFESIDDSLVRVTVEGVRVVLRRDGRVVARATRNVTAAVHSSVFALHDRVTRFERLLARDAFDGPGLDRRVTGLLHAVVWTRGMLQFTGFPVANVLANRHVELVTNRAVLSLQHAAFGRRDAEGRVAYRRARQRVGLRDVLAAVQEGATRRAAAVLRKSGRRETPAHVGIPSATDVTGAAVDAAGDASRESVPVGVNVTADRAFVEFVDGGGDHSLAGTLRDAYTTVADRVVEASKLHETTYTSGTVPAGWTLADASTTRETAILGDAQPERVLEDGLRRVTAFGRRVAVVERTTRRYVNGSRERTVVETNREVFRVTVAVGYEVTPVQRTPLSERAETVLAAPARSVTPAVHGRIVQCATALLADADVPALVERAATGDVATREYVLRPDVPRALRERAYRAAARLRDRARNVTANASVRSLAAGDVPVDALRSRVIRLHDAAASYGTVTARAEAAVRETYLARVDARIHERDVDGTLGDAGRALGERGLESPPSGRASRARAGPVAGVDAAPAYLTVAEVTPRMVAGVQRPYHPLAARNENWFTVPHGDAASAVLDHALPDRPATIRLATAGQALYAANRALAATDNRTLRERRGKLRAAVERGVSDAAMAYRGVLAASNVSFTSTERHAATRAALARWSTPAARAKAIANGSAARAVAAEAAQIAGVSGVRRDKLVARFRAEAPDVTDHGRVEVSPGLVRDTVSAARSVTRTVAKHALSHSGAVAAERALRRLGAANVGAVPAGLPLLPVPGFWYATVNAWSVSVHGSWAEFSVRAESGSPVGPGDTLVYTRERERVAFDVNGDGRADHVGRNERLSFDVDATVFVVVPAGPRGVGDVDGNRVEESPGW